MKTMQNIQKISILFFASLLLLACGPKDSIQKYLVDSQEKDGFVTFDISGSMLQLKEVANMETKEVLASIKKMNFAFLPIENNTVAFEAEKKRLKELLQKNSYKSFVKISDKKLKVSLLYSGSQEAMNEVVAIGYSDEVGVGVVRILGKNMNPVEISKALDKVDFSNAGEFKTLFKTAFSTTKE